MHIETELSENIINLVNSIQYVQRAHITVCPTYEIRKPQIS
jgi:hypothetical protein